MPVYFHSELPEFALEEQGIIEKWILAVITSHQKKTDNLNIIFTSNDYLLEINRKYLNHNYYTDVISFDDSNEDVVSGDIFVSVEQVKINSKFHNVGFINELCRVMIHGVLHLVGYNDTDEAQRAVMRTQEDHALDLLVELRDGKNI